MSLAEYRVSDAVDVSLVDPLAERLLGLLEHFGGSVLIVSGRRTWGEQQTLWLRYLAGGPLAARPGTSNHEHGGAADLRIVGDVTWRQVHTEAEIRGLRFPIPSEDWHVEIDQAWTPPTPEVEDMTPAQLAHALGPNAELGFDGVIRLPLINDQLNGHDKYPLGDVLTYIHQELKMRRLGS